MKYQKIIYWSASVLFAVWMLTNAYAYLTSEEAKLLCHHFGFPGYFRVELAIAKIIGVIVLLVPMIKGRWKEWAYAGFTITMISGFIAHLASGDSLLSASSAIVALAILLISYITYPNLKNSKQ
ncbi:MAG: DoxX-like family protein [Bacteroidetes bacterium 47-18]|nr:MAG: DoxX-like family protein [Bacteroidetes bacterium 47-18]